jgi:hypothetical protein
MKFNRRIGRLRNPSLDSRPRARCAAGLAPQDRGGAGRLTLLPGRKIRRDAANLRARAGKALLRRQTDEHRPT